MQIISCAKNIILSDFINLETKYIYENHTDGENCDFQFFGLRRFFVSVKKRIGIEILRAENETIQRIKKLKVENIYCASSPNQNDDEIALGLANGEIKFFNYRNLEYGQSFQSDLTRSSVLFLDYNATDDYLSSVYENGHINIYGIKTKQKIESLAFDKTCTLSKFHPIKRFHLGVATHKGAIYIYDTSSKKEIFHSIDAHESPCRDVAMSAGCSDLLLSVGFDCIINIFDIRKRNRTIQIDCECPLSSVAMSECGKYFCVGNLKGELISYDIRNTQSYLQSKKIHDKSISRIGFVPDQKMNEIVRKSMGIISGGGGGDSSTSSCSSSIRNQQQHPKQSDIVPVNKSCKRRKDSFFDFLDNFTSPSQNKTAGYRFSVGTNSSSPDIGKKINDFFSFSKSGDQNEFKNIGLTLDKMKITEEDNENENDSSIVFVSEKKHENEYEEHKSKQQTVLNKTPIIIPSCENSKIQNQNSQNDDLGIGTEVNDDDDDEEGSIYLRNKLQNNQRDTSNLFTKDIEEFPKLPDHKNSTPNNLEKNKKIIMKNEIDKETTNTNTNTNTVVINQIQLQNMWSDIKMEIQNLGKNLHTEIENLRTEMNTKFNQLENEIKYNEEINKWQIMNQNAHLYGKQHEVNEQVEEALFYLIKTDEFLNDYLRLKKENRELKNKLNSKSK